MCGMAQFIRLWRSIFRLPMVCWTVLCVLALPGADLAHTPEEILVVAHEKADKAVELARTYARLRGIPEAHVILLNVPVGEPYLQSFPEPEAFFGLLTEGVLSLAECYMVSLPYLSWKMVLVGDPLYRSFNDSKRWSTTCHQDQRRFPGVRKAGTCFPEKGRV